MNHIVSATFGAKRTVKTEPLYQYDYGQVVQFNGIDLPPNFEVNFGTSQSGTSLTVFGSDNQALIPDELLQTGQDVWAWVFLHDEITDGETEYVVRIPVMQRAKRDGTEPTPSQQDAIATAIEALNEATETLEGAIEQTEEYRDEAQDYATQAESWAVGGTGTRQGEDTDNAKYYAEQAESTAQSVESAVSEFTETTVPQAVQSVTDEGTAQIALVGAEGVAQVGAVGDAGTAQIALVEAEGTRQKGIVTAEGTTQKGLVTAEGTTQKGLVTAEGTAQVGNVQSEGTTQIGLVQSEGDTQVGLVRSEGASQVDNVESAGTTQVGNVSAEGSTQISAVQSAGSAQVGLVQAEGTAQISTVGSAGTTQIGLVGAKGTEQIAAVAAEGAEQIAAVEAKGAEVLSEIIDKAPVIVDTASGAIATFPDGAAMPVKSVAVEIDPVQDLHGYDNPWPAGGGKNLLLVSAETLQKPSYYGGTWTGTTVAQGENAITVTRGNGTGGYGGVVIDRNFEAGQYTFSCKAPVTTKEKNFFWGYVAGGSYSGQKSLGTKSASTTSISYTVTLPENTTSVFFKMTGHNNDVPITFTELQFEKGSTATAYAPYSNLCPITGWTGATVTRTGKNLFDKAHPNVYNGYIDVSTSKQVYSASHKTVYIPCKPNTTYTLQKVAVNSDTADRLYVGWSETIPAYQGTQIYGLKGKGSGFVAGDLYSFSVTTGATAKYLVCWLSRATEYDASLQTFQIEVGAIATAYESYTGNTYPISWQTEAGTVYGGTLTVNQDGTGTLSVDRIGFDGGSKTWTKISDYANGNFWVNASNLKYVQTRATVNSSMYKSSYNNAVSSSADNFVWVRARSTTVNDIYVKDTAKAEMTAEEFKTAMTGVQFVYERVSPITYTLTAQQVTTLLGANTIWADTGDVEVEYRADTKLYIDNGSNWIPTALSNIIASSETDWIASRNYTAKELVIVNNRLYKVTANIASGGAITVGTNVIAITLSDIIKTLI